MSKDLWPRTVAVLSEGRDWAGGLARTATEALRARGCEVDILGREDPWEKRYDFVLAYGPHTWPGSLLSAADRLERYTPEERPFFYWWYTDAPYRPDLPRLVSRPLARLHCRSTKFFRRHPQAQDRWWAKEVYKRFVREHFRLRNFGELFDLQSRGLIDGLAVTAFSRADYLKRHGLDAIVAPMGYHPSIHGRDLALERDIDVLFLGGVYGKRRVGLLNRAKEGLERRGIPLSICDSGLLGDERAEVLNRTKIVLTIMQCSYDIAGLRFLFCAANKTLLISEPVQDQEPFVPGRHFITAPVDKLAETVEYYLTHEDERREIVERAYRLITEEYTMAHMVDRLIDHAAKLSAAKGRRPSH